LNEKRSVRSELKVLFFEHLPLLSLLAAYIGSGFFLEAILSENDIIHLEWSIVLYRTHLAYSAIFYGIFFMYNILDAIVERDRESNPVMHAWGKIREQYLTIGCIGGFFLVFATFPLFFSTFNSFKRAIPLLQPFAWDKTFMEWDFILHGGRHPWEILQPYLGNPLSTKIIDFVYATWFKMIFVFFLWQAWSTKRRMRAQFFLSWVLLWTLCGTLAATILSSAGPCYYSRVIAETDPFRPLMAYLTSLHEVDALNAIHFQNYLWENYVRGGSDPFVGISAMPSIHVATVVLFAIAGGKAHRLLGLILGVYALIIQVGSVHLGWHYAIDGYFGAILALLIWKASGLLLSLWGRRRTESPGDSFRDDEQAFRSSLYDE
jgi:hypothetical protein